MKVLVLGTYTLDTYTRGKTLIKGLRKNNVDTEVFLESGGFKYFKILWRVLRGGYDAIIVNGRIALFISKIFSRKPVIFDFIISSYETQVIDRKVVKENSLKAKLLWLSDEYSCKFADLTLMINEEYINFAVSEFRVPKEKFKIAYVGADEEIFYPREPEKNTGGFIVEFHGSFIPHQGIEFIINAAEILRNEREIKFLLIGSGQMFDTIKDKVREKNLDNVSLPGWIKYENLPQYISNADVCLGVFGTMTKTEKSMPHKAFEVIAMKKPLITMRSKATEELFKDKDDVILVDPGNPKELASAILLLKNDAKLREKIAENAYMLFQKKFISKKIGEEVKKYLEEVTSS